MGPEIAGKIAAIGIEQGKPVEKDKLVKAVSKAARERTIFSGAQPKV